MRGRPTRRQQILDLLRQADGAWVDWSEIATAGGGQYNARVLELRAQGYTIEQRGQGASSQYRLAAEKSPEYETFDCPCGWHGAEPQALRDLDGGYLCPHCQEPVGQTLLELQKATYGFAIRVITKGVLVLIMIPLHGRGLMGSGWVQALVRLDRAEPCEWVCQKP